MQRKYYMEGNLFVGVLQFVLFVFFFNFTYSTIWFFVHLISFNFLFKISHFSLDYHNNCLHYNSFSYFTLEMNNSLGGKLKKKINEKMKAAKEVKRKRKPSFKHMPANHVSRLMRIMNVFYKQGLDFAHPTAFALQRLFLCGKKQQKHNYKSIQRCNMAPIEFKFSYIANLALWFFSPAHQLHTLFVWLLSLLIWASSVYTLPRIQPKGCFSRFNCISFGLKEMA